MMRVPLVYGNKLVAWLLQDRTVYPPKTYWVTHGQIRSLGPFSVPSKSMPGAVYIYGRELMPISNRVKVVS